MACRIFRSAVWRLSAVYAVAFLACALLFSFAAWRMVEAETAKRLSALAEHELASVLDKAGSGRPDEVTARATAVVLARAARQEADFLYGLQRPGAPMAGDFPGPLPAQGGRVRIAESSGPGWAMAAAAVLPDGARLVVAGRAQASEIQGDVARILGISLALASISALLVGPWAGRRVLRQVAAVNRACDRVSAGDLRARAPGAEADDEFGALARHVNGMLERVEGLVQGLQDVSNRVAHELRTPMARLRGDLEDAAAAPDLATSRRILGVAAARTDELLQTFEAMLDIVEVEAGSVGGLAPMRLDAALQAAVELYGPVAEDKEVVLRLAAEPAPIIGEHTLIVRLAANLLDNAIKFSPAGGMVQVGCERRGHEVVLAVEDRGPGVRPEEREKVLGRFQRGTAADAAPGHGLGLALVAAVAKRHGARLSLEDAGPGLRVRVAFPAFSG